MEQHVSISYKTLTLHRAGIDLPFNDWSPTHIRQGFSWRPESVSFRTLDPEISSNMVVVDLRDSYSPPPQARRVIRVPLSVDTRGIEVTSPVSDAWTIAIPPGHYALFFSIEPADAARQDGPGEAWGYHLTFVPSPENVPAEILRADDQLDPPGALLMEAQPAE